MLQMSSVWIILRVGITRYHFDRIQVLLRTDGLVGVQMAMVLIVVPVLSIVSTVDSVGLLLDLSRLILIWHLLRQWLLSVPLPSVLLFSVLLLPVHHYRAVV